MAAADLDRPWPTFSLSASGVSTLQTCLRRYYLQTYWAWTGWRTDAKPSRQRAYRLKTAISAASHAGTIVHAVAARYATAIGRGRDVRSDDDRDVDGAERRYRAEIREAANRRLERATKRAPALLEAVYGDPIDVDGGAATVRACVRELQTSEYLSALAADVAAGGRLLTADESELTSIRLPIVLDSSSLLVPIWVRPDLAWITPSTTIVVLDWKTGRRRDSDATQMALYGLWASQAQPHTIDLITSYLRTGESSEYRCTPDAGHAVVEVLSTATRTIRERIVGGDLDRHEPIRSPEVWPQIPEGSRECSWCPFRGPCGRGRAIP
jgi:hypothetical protein